MIDGQVDVVVLASSVADDAIARIEAAGDVQDLPELATVSTMHAVTWATNPNGQAYLAALNNGVQKLRENGQWFEIVQRHLVAHARNTAALRN